VKRLVLSARPGTDKRLLLPPSIRGRQPSSSCRCAGAERRAVQSPCSFAACQPDDASAPAVSAPVDVDGSLLDQRAAGPGSRGSGRSCAHVDPRSFGAISLVPIWPRPFIASNSF